MLFLSCNSIFREKQKVVNFFENKLYFYFVFLSSSKPLFAKRTFQINKDNKIFQAFSCFFKQLKKFRTFWRFFIQTNKHRNRQVKYNKSINLQTKCINIYVMSDFLFLGTMIPVLFITTIPCHTMINNIYHIIKINNNSLIINIFIRNLYFPSFKIRGSERRVKICLLWTRNIFRKKFIFWDKSAES